MAIGVQVIDPLLPDEGAATMLSLWREFGSYGQYSNESAPASFAPELAQRYDATINFIRTGGRFGRSEDRAVLAARTNYFRETYSYGDDVFLPGIERLRDNEELAAAARRLHGRPVVVPAIVYANILLPGQELALHTDVPEFRGANRKVLPQWLCVVMHHSGLFDEWRMPIATGITYFGNASGGALAYYPDGPGGDAATYTPQHNTAAVLDTDSIFHGVDRVDGDDSALASLRPGMRLHHEGDEQWTVRDGEQIVAKYETDDLRYSVSWKAYCFVDDGERAAWESHSDDLTLETILGRLVDDLVTRGRLASAEARPDDATLGRLLIEEYVQFPAPAE
jgi:hypothetical protein